MCLPLTISPFSFGVLLYSYTFTEYLRYRIKFHLFHSHFTSIRFFYSHCGRPLIKFILHQLDYFVLFHCSLFECLQLFSNLPYLLYSLTLFLFLSSSSFLPLPRFSIEWSCDVDSLSQPNSYANLIVFLPLPLPLLCYGINL